MAKTKVKALKFNTHEVLVAFAAFLTMRKHPIVLSAQHDASSIAQLVGKFADANGLPKVRDKWPDWVEPVGAEYITNIGGSANQRPLTGAEATQKVWDIINSLHVKDQNELIAVLLNKMQQSRMARLKTAEEAAKLKDELLTQAEEAVAVLGDIRGGSFDKLNFR